MNNGQDKPSGKVYRSFEFLTEAVGWLQIMASPFLAGLVGGALIYFGEPTGRRLIMGVTVAVVGLVTGVIWATKKWKGEGTVHFLSKIMATPELDNSGKNNEKL